MIEEATHVVRISGRKAATPTGLAAESPPRTEYFQLCRNSAPKVAKHEGGKSEQQAELSNAAVELSLSVREIKVEETPAAVVLKELLGNWKQPRPNAVTLMVTSWSRVLVSASSVAW